MHHVGASEMAEPWREVMLASDTNTYVLLVIKSCSKPKPIWNEKYWN
jgi:hypothetical protein